MPETLISAILNYLWKIVENWWWLPAPFVLWRPFLFLYLWWRIDRWLSKQRMVLLEIKIPRDVVKPIRAMEQVMAGFHGAVTHPPDFWEKWIDGQVQLSLSFEIVSIEGMVHFYVRTASTYRDSVEASLYSQYPEAEIEEVPDYTKSVPQNIPNKEWDLWAADYKMVKDDHYPIKTYPKFETEHEVLEEKRVDPVALLLEVLSRVKPGEQFWIQITAEPISDADIGHSLSGWIKSGQVIRDQLARRTAKAAPKPIIQEAAELFITGQPAKEEKKEELIPPEMKLTPGEREIITALEEKMSKPIFRTNIRFIYLGKRESWFKANFRLAFAYFTNFATVNLNAIYPMGQTITKIKKSLFLPINQMRPRRHYLRCRKIFRNYVNRLSPYFPRPGGSFMMNTEELASLFHFPSEAVAPALGAIRTETKKGGAPSELPIEE